MLKNKRAVTAISYGLISALIIILALGALASVGTGVKDTFLSLHNIIYPIATPVKSITGAPNQYLYGGMTVMAQGGNIISYTITNDSDPGGEEECSDDDNGTCMQWITASPYNFNGAVFSINDGDYILTIPSSANNLGCDYELEGTIYYHQGVLNPFTDTDMTPVSQSTVKGNTVCNFGPVSSY